MLLVFAAAIFTGCPESPGVNSGISSFIFRAADNAALTTDITAVIDGKAITAAVTVGTAVTALIADAAISEGASISPDPAAAADYTSPVTYTVTAADGTTTAEYSVTVNVGGSAGSDITAPIPGNLSVKSVGLESIMLEWTGASDETTAGGALEYRLYYSALDNITGVTEAETNGTAVGSGYSASSETTVTSLAQTTNYYFTVLTQDEAGNKAAYQSISQSTRIGTIENNLSVDEDDAITAVAAEGPYVYTAGWVADASSNIDWFIEKRSIADGSAVDAFGTNGIIMNIWSGDEQPTAMKISGDYLIVSGYDTTQSNTQWRTEIYNKQTGENIFGKQTNPNVNNDYLNGIEVDGDYIFLAGSQYAYYMMRLEKRKLSDLTYATGFNTTGFYTEDPDGSSQFFYNDVTVDESSVYAGGDWNNGEQYYIDKFDKTNGAADTGFGTDGRLIFGPIEGYGDRLRALEYKSGYLYAVCSHYDGGITYPDSIRIYKISPTDGSFVTSFGDGGSNDYLTINPAGYNPLKENPLMLDSTSIYTASGINNLVAGSNAQWYIEKRSLASGELDSFFGSSGVINEDLDTGTIHYHEYAHAIFIDDLNVYVGGRMWNEGDSSYECYLKIYDKVTGD